jgi:hypothetical protein
MSTSLTRRSMGTVARVGNTRAMPRSEQMLVRAGCRWREPFGPIRLDAAQCGARRFE